MKLLSHFTILFVITGIFASCSSNSSSSYSSSKALEDLSDSASYAIGMAIAADFSQVQIQDLNMTAFLAGYYSQDDPGSARIPESEIGSIIEKYISQKDPMDQTEIKVSPPSGKLLLKNNPKIQLKNLLDSASYAIGYYIASDFAEGDLEFINMNAFVDGYYGYHNTGIAKISQDDMHMVIETYFMQKARDQFPAIIEGEEFLEANATEEGVITSDSGLQYIVVKEGKGKSPQMFDTVVVHYHGTTIKNVVFDSSIDGDPVRLVLGNVIEGWNEALPLMKEGGKMKIFVPAELAYGPRNMGVIRSYETLIFEIELLEVIKGKAPEFDPALLEMMMRQQQY